MNEVLVLNHNYLPINITSRRRALVLLFLGKAHKIDDSLDSIVRLNTQVRRPAPEIHPTRKGIFARDGNRCVYCGSTHRQLTVDHVMPKSRGGGNTWENLVCCCTECNNFKGDRTPEEAGMELPRKPKKPHCLPNISYHKLATALRRAEWADFLAPYMSHA